MTIITISLRNGNIIEATSFEKFRHTLRCMRPTSVTGTNMVVTFSDGDTAKITANATYDTH